ncbi:MAG: DUF4143 domain-containing protein [Bacteroidales bacterium]|nr:DUF4143 domain-containing protein [Bacteroidales bacterium]
MISHLLPGVEDHQILLLTGARQTGKTSLVRQHYNTLPYYNLDAIEFRDQLSAISTFSWAREIGMAVIDEIQKEPGLFDKIKYAFDDGGLKFSVLTGSSQILLLKKVRETMAGRITLRELFPFMLGELIYPSGSDPESTLLFKLISTPETDDILEDRVSVLIGKDWDLAKTAESWLNIWGGMAPMIHITTPRKKRFWLNDYATAYLERDLADLASLHDLKPFRKFQQISALRAANLLSYSELAKDSGIGIETARRYLEYLRISYQAFLLQPFHKNLTSSLIKTPKLYWFDNGLLRHLSGLGFDLDNGQLYENYIASEFMKFIRTTRSEAKLSFYRTRSGMEIDFILETTHGLLGFEVKSRDTVTASDFTNLNRLAEAASAEWLGGFIIYRGNKLEQFGKRSWAIPSVRLFS